MVAHWLAKFRHTLPPEVNEALDQAQLTVLRGVVRFNRAAAEAYRAVRPMAVYWWMPVAGLGVGVVAGIASRLAG